MTTAQPTDVDFLRVAIAASGLSARQYALQVMARDPQTVHRWLHGARMPRVVSDWIRRGHPERAPKEL